MSDPIKLKFYPVSVFEGGNGDLVLCQAWPSESGERFTRIVVEMKDAEKLAYRILTKTIVSAVNGAGEGHNG